MRTSKLKTLTKRIMICNIYGLKINIFIVHSLSLNNLLGMRFGTLCIIGPGLIGGSIGLGLKKKNLVKTVIGVGHKASSLEKAVKMHAIDTGSLIPEKAVKDADIVILATSVSQIVDSAKAIIPCMKSNAILTDVGSTKKYIVERITNSLRSDISFVGAHPIAGSEQRGIEFATADLFEGSACIITPFHERGSEDEKVSLREPKNSDVQSTNYMKALETVTSLWQLLGAKVKILTPEAHDEILASVSHLPHVTASCLINAIRQDYLIYGAGGLKDTTRIASGDPELWRDIFKQNRENVIKTIDRLIIELNGFKDDLANRNYDTIIERLKKAKMSRDGLFQNNSAR